MLLKHVDAFLAVHLESILVLQDRLHLHHRVGIAPATRPQTGFAGVVKEGKKAVVIFL